MKIKTKVVGVTFRPDSVLAARSHYIETGEGSLDLIREPANEHDRNAIKVAYRLTGNQLGYVSRSLAEQIAPHLDSGIKTDARILQFTGGTQGAENLGINIELNLPGVLRTYRSKGFGKCHTCGIPFQQNDFIAKKGSWWSHGKCLGLDDPTESRQELDGCASIVALVVALV